MSNYLAIATVTSTLRDLVDSTVNAILPGVTVTMQRPEKAGNGNGNQAGVNVYLYQVMPNAAWRNSDIVIRRPNPQAPDNRGKDTLEQHAQIPLNLHYLFSFYGDDQRLEPQRLLGQVVSTLEAKPVLSLDNIRAAIQHHEAIKQSDLDFQAEHIERIKLAPLSLSLEDLSKLWSVFFQVPYVLSVAYEASVVLIEPSAALTVPLVTERNIGVDPDLSKK